MYSAYPCTFYYKRRSWSVSWCFNATYRKTKRKLKRAQRFDSARTENRAMHFINTKLDK